MPESPFDLRYATYRSLQMQVISLTFYLGDERPCLRCIKRGLQDHCHDGVRKKAKYLHDAPNDVLVPGVSATYPVNGTHQNVAPITSLAPPTAADAPSLAHPGPFYPNSVASGNFPGYSLAPNPAAANSPSNQDSPVMNQYNNQQSSLLPSPYPPSSNPQMSASQDPASTMKLTSPESAKQTQPFAAPFFDPSDPSIFNFDISGLNFGNHYGAMEFGMLGHMSSGAVGTPDVDNSLLNSMGSGNVRFDPSNPSNTYASTSAGFPYGPPAFADWQDNTGNGPRQGSTGHLFGPQITATDGSTGFDAQPAFPNAFAIGEGNGSISSASPSGNLIDFNNSTGYGSSPVSSAANFYPNQSQGNQQDASRQKVMQHRAHAKSSFPSSNELYQQSINRKRRRDPSEIYSSVVAPYSYTSGFHNLTAFLQKRFSPQKTLRIAKALASIRPSFISCTKQLNRDDLIFMEKCFQRTLWEYEDFLNAYGTPTVICRRTGEVAAVSKEFSLLTGWRKDVLLGKEVNLNVNTGGTSGVHTGTSSRGAVTPRAPNSGCDATPGRPQPVFLAELLDDDSVIDFYEDFAKLAFGDSRGYVIKPCKLLKYKPKDDSGWGADQSLASSDATMHGTDKNSRTSTSANPLISGEAGMNSLGERDGKVNCMFCWSVKRDVFDIPMLIVMNVSYARSSNLDHWFCS